MPFLKLHAVGLGAVYPLQTEKQSELKREARKNKGGRSMGVKREMHIQGLIAEEMQSGSH